MNTWAEKNGEKKQVQKEDLNYWNNLGWTECEAPSEEKEIPVKKGKKKITEE